jgi:hypothetical protein
MKTDRYARFALAVIALALASVTAMSFLNLPLSYGASDSSEVLKSLAGRWNGVTSGGLGFVWTVDENGQYESTYRQAGREVRRRGALVVGPDGTMRYRSEDGQTGTLTISRGGSGPLRLRGSVSGGETTFEATQVEARSVGPARTPTENAASKVTVKFFEGFWTGYTKPCAARALEVGVGVPEETDLADDAIARSFLEVGRKYALSQCPTGMNNVTVNVMKGTLPKIASTPPGGAVHGYYVWRDGDLVFDPKQGPNAVRNTVLQMKSAVEEQMRQEEQRRRAEEEQRSAQEKQRLEAERRERLSIADLQRERLDRESAEKRRKQAIRGAFEKAFEHFHVFGVGLVREYVRKGLVLTPPTSDQILRANAVVNGAAIPPSVEPAVKAQFEKGTVVSIGTGMMGEFGRALLIAPAGNKDLFSFSTWISGFDESVADCQIGVRFGWPGTGEAQATSMKYACGSDVFTANKGQFEGMFEKALRAYLQR